MKLLWELYITFAKIGACTFGGGYAMLPIDVYKRQMFSSTRLMSRMFPPKTASRMPWSAM